MRLNNVTALVTGASSGIGEAVSSHFRREGARLLLTGRREQLDSAEPDDLYVPGDLNDEAFVERLAKQAAESFGTVDVVVLNHGLQAVSPLTEMACDDAKSVLESNLLSAFLVMKHFAPLMPETGERSSASVHGWAWWACPGRSCIPLPREASSCWPRARRSNGPRATSGSTSSLRV